MVRLKHNPKIVEIKGHYFESQFHYGSIKTFLEADENSRLPKLSQFHYGSIKTQHICNSTICHSLNLNSTMVRLKLMSH